MFQVHVANTVNVIHKGQSYINGDPLRYQQWSSQWHTDLELALMKCRFGQPPPQLQVPSPFFSSIKTKEK